MVEYDGGGIICVPIDNDLEEENIQTMSTEFIPPPPGHLDRERR